MVWRLLLSAVLATVLSVSVGLFVVGCSSVSGSVSGSAGFVEFDVVVNSQGKLEARLKGSLPPGICLEVSFIGADGKVIETATTGVPGYLPVPTGTVGHGYKFVDCNTLTGAPASSTGTAGMGTTGHQGAASVWHELVFAPVAPDFDAFNPMSNSMAIVRMKLPAGVDPMESLLDLIAAGPGAPTGADVEVDFFGQMIPTGNGARLIVADDEPIVDYSLTWNGVANYAEIGSDNVTQYAAPNGWSIVQTMIPLADFALGQPAWNGGTATVLSASAQVPTSVTTEVQAFTP